MISSSRGESNRDLQAKQEGDTNIINNNNNNEASKFPKAPSSSRQWSAFRNPRIVRVSRTFGGKDRHSKVCTVRGLRDRRIRLSVPTAIQLYDLQDRLGLNQPSKVIDWLLDATKNDIDKLPPLQMPQGFGQFHSPMLFPHHDSSASQSAFPSPGFFDPNNINSSSSFLKDGGFHHPLGIKIGGLDGEDHNNILARSKYWEVEASLRAKSKEVEGASDKGKWVRTIEEENQDGVVSNYGGQVSAHKLFPLTTSHSSLPSGLLGNPMPFSSYYHLDASNLSLAQLGSQGFLSQQPESSGIQSNNNANINISLPSSLALASGSHHHHQLFFCPQPATLPSLFPAYPPFATSAMEGDPQARDINNHFQLLSSSPSQSLLQGHHLRATSYPVRPFSLSVNPGLAHAMQGSNESHPHHQERDHHTEDS